MKRYLVDINLPSSMPLSAAYLYQSKEDGGEPVEISVTVRDIVTLEVLASTHLGYFDGKASQEKGPFIESSTSVLFPLTSNDLKVVVREEGGSEVVYLSLGNRPEGHFAEVKVAEVRSLN